MHEKAIEKSVENGGGMEQEHFVICSGYGAEGAEDIVTVRIVCGGEEQKNGTDLSTGDVKTEKVSGIRQGSCPSFGLVCGRAFYTVEELAGEAYLRKYELCKGGQLRDTGRRLEIPGGELCHLYAGEKALYASCYGTGDFCAVDFDLENVLWHRKPEAGERKPHAHWASEKDGILYLSDLGSDRVYRYRLKDGLPGEELLALELEEGAGPRQALPLENGLVLTVQELDSTLRLWRAGKCAETVRTTVFDGTNYPGTICMADEKTVLVCNRGANTVAAFRLETGREAQKHLIYSGEWPTGDWPRHLHRILGTNLFLNACNKEGALILFGWTGTELVRKGRVELPGASCAAQSDDILEWRRQEV